jgi:conjugal transfer/entry exclusion protein
MNCLRLVVAISAMTLAVFAGPKPGAAQLVVFDPNNYAQNGADRCTRSTAD